MRIFHAVTHTCPSRQVDYGIKWPLFLEKTFKRLLVLDVEFVEAKLFSIFVSLELIKSPILESNIIIIIEVVDSDHSMPMVEQFPANPRGDKACNSSNEIFFTQA